MLRMKWELTFVVTEGPVGGTRIRVEGDTAEQLEAAILTLPKLMERAARLGDGGER